MMVSNTRGTIGGDQVHYPGVTAAYVAHLDPIHILLNTAASDDAEIGTADISDFYLGTPFDRIEYMRISLKHIPPDIQKRYNIARMVHNDNILMEISKRTYGLLQFGKLSQDRLVQHLATNEYIQCADTHHSCLFTKQTELYSLWLWTIFSLSSKNVNQQITC